ncbi:MAG: hypothetical protein GC159_19055 [Phycisphaera sp.]|nr:hypothetical protein [Phycisphaera sp.]
MIRRYVRRSIAWSVPGITLSVGSMVYALQYQKPTPTEFATFLAIAVPGMAMFVLGMMDLARAKRRHPAWGLLGIGGLLGAVGLLLIPDQSVIAASVCCTKCGRDLDIEDTACPTCGATRD